MNQVVYWILFIAASLLVIFGGQEVFFYQRSLENQLEFQTQLTSELKKEKRNADKVTQIEERLVDLRLMKFYDRSPKRGIMIILIGMGVAILLRTIKKRTVGVRQ